MELTGLTRGTVRYWERKVLEAPFHPRSHGGARNFAFTVAQHTIAEAVLLNILDVEPACTLDNLAKKVHQYGCTGVSRAWVARTLTGWNYTHKRIYHIQQHKFTELNVLRYIDHIFGVCQLDPTRIKYLDESRFESRSEHCACV